MSMRRFARTLLAAATIALIAIALPGEARADAEPHDHAAATDPNKYAEELQGFVPGASALEGRILAPCCWNQTIDIHGSEISNNLRRDIRRRLKAGESPDTIQASLVAQYGDRILAVPPGSPLKSIASLLALGLIGAGAAGFFMLKRWRDRGTEHAKREVSANAQSPNDAKLDARLDAELKALDD
jgi:cytochrome c-type biogenesis protein CcmH